MRSVGWSGKGKHHVENEDAYLQRDDVGLWAVADGVGGLSRGAQASQYLVNALMALQPVNDLGEDLPACLDLLETANRSLRQRSADSPMASTLCGLLIAGGRCSVFWAGDSRAYRITRGRFYPLTEDHGGAAMGMADHVITRAFGLADHIVIDRQVVDLGAEDQVLLCTDGFYSVLNQVAPSLLFGGIDCPGPDVVTYLNAVSSSEEFVDDATWVLINRR